MKLLEGQTPPLVRAIMAGIAEGCAAAPSRAQATAMLAAATRAAVFTLCRPSEDCQHVPDLQQRLQVIGDEMVQRVKYSKEAQDKFTHSHQAYTWVRKEVGSQEASGYRRLARQRNRAVHDLPATDEAEHELHDFHVDDDTLLAIPTVAGGTAANQGESSEATGCSGDGETGSSTTDVDMQTKEEPTQLFIGANIAEKSCQYEPSAVDTKALRSVGVQAAPCTRKGRGILGPLRHGSSAGTATPGLQQTHNSVDLPTAKRTSKQHNGTAYSLGNASKDDTAAEWLLEHTAEPGQRRVAAADVDIKEPFGTVTHLETRRTEIQAEPGQRRAAAEDFITDDTFGNGAAQAPSADRHRALEKRTYQT